MEHYDPSYLKFITLTSESRDGLAAEADFVIRKDTCLTENFRNAVKIVLV